MSELMTTPFDINWRHLGAIRAIGRCGSINAAAKAVFLSQPAITQALAKLERLLQISLFERSAGGMVPTQAGATLIVRADRAAAHLANGAKALRAASGGRGSSALDRQISGVHLHAVIAVVVHGNFALAARETGLSQPSIHRAARDLERLAAVPLLVRRGRTVEPTNAAESFVRHARLAVAEIAAGLDEIEIMRGATGGRIAVGAMPLCRSWLLPRAVTALNRESPLTQFEIVEGPYLELLSDLRGGDLDVLIGALRDPPPASDVIQVPLFEDRAVIVARAEHPLASTQHVNLTALKQFPWIVARQGTPLRDHWATMFSREGIAPPLPTVECGSVVAITAMLLEDDWLTLLSPDQIRREQNARRLTVIGQPLKHARRIIGATVRRSWFPSATQTRFLTILTDLARQTSIN